MNSSEIAVKYIMEKLISIVITKSTRTEIEKKIPTYCYDYLHNLLNDTLNLDIITCDIDLTEKQLPNFNDDNKQTEIYFVNRIYGINDYALMPQPVNYILK